jgi:predicted nucleic acid-binding protein
MRASEKTSARCFIDTNIWLYAFIESSEAQKRASAKAIVQSFDVVISTQVINETCVNLLKKTSLQEAEIRRLVAAFYTKYTVTKIERSTLLTASELREKYSLSFWDSVIVACALWADCSILYTEDMQHGLKVDEKLTIVNPFKQT